LSGAEWPEAEMLAREKAVLGFYITKHPLASHEHLLRACSTVTTNGLGRYEDGDSVVIGGMVSSLRIVVTKSGRNAGRKIGIVTLEDLNGRIEAIVFPKQLETYRALLAPDAIVFLEGEVDRKREEPSLRVARVVAHEDAMGCFVRAVLLDLPEPAPVDRLVEILNANHGESPVYLNVHAADDMLARIECHPRLRIRCCREFLTEVSDLFGTRAVTILGPARENIPMTLLVPNARPKREPVLA